MSEEKPQIYEFGTFRLDAARQLLFRNDQPVPMTPKLFDTLRIPVERGGEQLSKDELMRGIWGETIVEETNLTTNVSHLRKLLGEKKNEHQYMILTDDMPNDPLNSMFAVLDKFNGNLAKENPQFTQLPDVDSSRNSPSTARRTCH